MDLISVIIYAFLILIVAPAVIIFIYQWLSNSPKFTKERSKIEIEKENKTFEYIKKKYKLHHTITHRSLKRIYENVDYNDEVKMKEYLIEQSYSSIYKTVKTKPKKVKSQKELKIKLTDEQKHWLNLVNIRVDALPFDFIERTYTIDSMGEEHASEYINNEFKVPKDKRKEVALSRVEGLSSIQDYIKSNGSKKQKFHYESSLKGALLYASSLGINIDKY